MVYLSYKGTVIEGNVIAMKATKGYVILKEGRLKDLDPSLTTG